MHGDAWLMACKDSLGSNFLMRLEQNQHKLRELLAASYPNPLRCALQHRSVTAAAHTTSPLHVV